MATVSEIQDNLAELSVGQQVRRATVIGRTRRRSLVAEVRVVQRTDGRDDVVFAWGAGLALQFGSGDWATDLRAEAAAAWDLSVENVEVR